MISSCPNNHDAMQPQVVDGHAMLVVREWVQQELSDAGAALTGVYVDKGKRRTLHVHLTGGLLRVSPRLTRRNDGMYATVWEDEEKLVERLIIPREGATVTQGEGVTRRQWDSHTQLVTQAWHEKTSGMEKWTCEVCGQGESWLQRRTGRAHARCEDYHRKWEN